MEVLDKIIDQLEFDPINARKHPVKNIEAIKGSLTKFGQQKPIVINSKGIVIAGNGTLMAAKALGWKTIKAVVSDLNDLNQMAFALADNRTSELAEWDQDILSLQLAQLDLNDFDTDSIGFEDFEIPDVKSGSDGLSDPDEVPEVAQNVFGVKRGDVFILGNHRLMCGDSTSEEDVKKLMDGTRAVFCFTSPPYADMREYNGGKELSTKHLAKFLSAPCDLFAVNLGIQRKDNEIVQYWDDYIQAAREYGQKFLSWNVWNKDLAGSISNQSAMFSIIHEWIFIFGNHKKLNRIFKNDTEENEKRRRYDPVNIKGKSQRLVRQKDGSTKLSNRGETFDCKQMGSICHETPVMDRSIDHPAQYPVGLPEQYYLGCTNQNDIVYEPFCGSGTSIIAAEKTGRICYGMELDEHYCSVIIKRWQDFSGKQAVKDGGVFNG
jgi:DNA modification methylase